MTTATRARWYTHGWNRETSWRLMLGILPRVPRFMHPVLHLTFTTICFLAMSRERRASRRNLERVTGARGVASLRRTWMLFHNFSYFMTAYVGLPPWGEGSLEGRIVASRLDGARSGNGSSPGDGLEPIRQALERGRGAILLGMHLGQWDLALIALARAGYAVTVVMRREDEEASRVADACRRAAGIRVVHAGESPWLFVGLLSALRRNEIVAMQGDRDMGGRTSTVSLFGRNVRIPAGPWELSARSGAPVLPGALLIRRRGRYEMAWAKPVEGDPGRGSPVSPDAAAMESLIGRYPEQWFNFYDVWEA